MLATTPEELAARRRVVAASEVLRSLADRLRRLAVPIAAGPLWLPDRKAQLSQTGGVCSRDGSRLAFDPLSPTRHRCPVCATEFTGDDHDGAWTLRYHLWLSERAVHLAVLGALLRDGAATRRAAEILDAYAKRYRDYPNADNVLGPTRLFFSTYLESIWLTQIAFAASLVDLSNPGGGWRGAARDRVRTMAAESVEIIGSFDEAWSNRQVWNNTAMIAAGTWLDQTATVERGVRGPHGVLAQLESCVSGVGFWHEGENYHFFALRGLVLAAEALRNGEFDLYRNRRTRGPLAAMFGAPLLSVLPDLTVPARGDSPYGVSLRQPRFAELWEVGRARTGDGSIDAFLAQLYSNGPQPDEDHGFTEIAELETNRPAQRVVRSQLGWKALLWMEEPEPANESGAWRTGSRLLAQDGLAILRPRSACYASLECGPGRPGHGHPDLLHVSLFWETAWLSDPGTGSYVSPSLGWYRSALAHNAPAVAEVGQRSLEGFCSAFDAGDTWSWCRAEGRELFGPATRAVRTIVVGPEYVLDVVDIDAPDDTEIDLPIHPLGGIQFRGSLERTAASLGRGGLEGHEHGYDWARDLHALSGGPVRFEVSQDDHRLDMLLAAREGETVFAGRAPGPPSVHVADGAPSTLLVRRARGAGRWVQVYGPAPLPVERVDVNEAGIALHRGRGSTDAFAEVPGGLRIREASGREVELGGLLPDPGRRPTSPAPPVVVPCPLLDRIPPLESWREGVPAHAVRVLSRAHYRRSERPYQSAADFSAAVAVFACGSTLCFAVAVRKPDVLVAADSPGATGLDNEAADIHSDGVQCYVRLDGWHGYLVLPDLETGAVRVRGVAGTSGDPSRVTGRSARTHEGYHVLVELASERPIARGDRIPVNVVVNQMVPGRTRRAGQLVLSGGGDWVYLRGDREDVAQAVVAEVS